MKRNKYALIYIWQFRKLINFKVIDRIVNLKILNLWINFLFYCLCVFVFLNLFSGLKKILSRSVF